MKIVQPYANIIGGCGTPLQDYRGIMALQHIEWCARISHRSEEMSTGESYKRFIQAVVIDKGDWSVVEHSSISVDALVDRGVTHEWVRHRLASYTQESTRFVNYTKDGHPPQYIYPKPDVICDRCARGVQELVRYAEEISHHSHGADYECAYDQEWLFGIWEADRYYKGLLAKGWRPQEARSVLPNALASRIVTTANLRQWRHFLLMRTSKESHPQMRQVTIPLLKQFQDLVPLLFDDISPENTQAENMRKQH